MWETYESARDRFLAWTVILLMLWGGAALIFFTTKSDTAAIPLGWGIILGLLYPIVVMDWWKMRRNR